MQTNSSPTGHLDANGPPSTLVKLLRGLAQRHPDRRLYTFLTDEGQEDGHFTCDALDDRARAIGAMLQASQAAGQRAILLYPPGLEFIAGFLGCLYAGVIAIPAPPPNPTRLQRTIPRLQAIAKDAGVTLGLTVSSYLQQIEQMASLVTELRNISWVATDQAEPGLAAEWRDPDVSPDLLAYLQYTSGSTSMPKGVMVSHANVLRNSAYIREGWWYEPESISVVWIPYYHDDGLVHGILQPLYTGYHAVLMSPLSFVQQPARWLRAITRYRATHSGGPNFAYELCVRKIPAEKRADLDLSSWQMAYNAAEPVRAETLRRFAEAFKPCGFRWESLCPAYGLAEATLLVSTRRKADLPVLLPVKAEALARDNRVVELEVDDRARTLVGCGHAVGQTEIVIVDPETMMRCAPDQVGEIWIKDQGVAQGYWKRPDDTKRTFEAYLEDTGDGPFLRTGDLGFIRNGELFITGRHKDLIVIRGQNHYPQDIEWSAERSHSSLRPGCCAAFSIDVDGEERLVVVIEVDQRKPAPDGNPRSPNRSDWLEVIGGIRQSVAENHDLQLYAVTLLAPGSIAKTSSGKIQRHACRQGFLAGDLAQYVVADWVQGHSEGDRLTAARPVAAEAERVWQVSKSEEAIQNWLLTELAGRLSMDRTEFDIRMPLARYGIDSAQAINLTGDLEAWLGCRLAPTILYERPTIKDLAGFLARNEAGGKSVTATHSGRAAKREPIAIIGIGCRFPKAKNPVEFWRLLRDGVDAISEVPPDRWSLDEFFDPDPSAPGKLSTRWGGFIHQVEGFDPHFFGLSPREAMRVDPQQRLLLEVVWEALADACQAPDRLAGTRAGVFIGISTAEYGWMQLRDLDQLDAHWSTGNSLSIAANRLSYIFNFRGPSIAIDTACSSSLVAVHQACVSLWRGEASLAIAGGVSLMLSPIYTISLTKAGLMSPDGRCKAFDARANGYVRGEGAGLVILKPLTQAIADGDPIYATIKGGAVNNDGRSNGLMAPNPMAQEAMLREAYLDAEVSPGQVQYVETHGTGTLLGDPIEAKALGAALSTESRARQRCAIGSVKTNIGHLEAAAGIAGLIKVALALKHQMLPPSLHFETPNPHIPFDELPLRVQRTLAPWPSGERPALAGVSSFGFGGTNAHLVLEAAPEPRIAAKQAGVETDGPFLLPVSAHTEAALRSMARAYLDHFASRNGESTDSCGELADLCYTASLRSHHHDHRLALVGRDHDEMAERLNKYLQNELRDRKANETRAHGETRKLVFIFSGEGSQWIGMGRRLASREPIFQEALQIYDRALRAYTGWSALDLLARPEADWSIETGNIVQPMLFAIQMGLVTLWSSWGIKPSAVVGQSMGEVTAAHVAGALTVEDAAMIIARRSRLMMSVSGKGQMVAVDLPLREAESVLKDYQAEVSIGISNSPTSTVLSGDPAALERIVRDLQRREIVCRQVKIDVASHSPQMESLRDALFQALEGLKPQPPTIPFYSTVTGAADDRIRFDTDYWWRNLREPALFSAAVTELVNHDHKVLIEISPHPALLGAVRETAHYSGRECVTLPSMRREEDERRTMLNSLGSLYELGYPVNWEGIHREPRRCVRLPSYPWQRERYWIGQDRPQAEASWRQNGHAAKDTTGRSLFDDVITSSSHADAQVDQDANSGADANGSPLTPFAADQGGWLYGIEWRHWKRMSSELAELDGRGRWLIFSDLRGTGDALRSLFESRGGNCVIVYRGDAFNQPEPGIFHVDPRCPEDFQRLIGEIHVHDQPSWRGIAHLWSLDAEAPKDTGSESIETANEYGCLSVLYLTQALVNSRVYDDTPVQPPRLWLVTRGTQAVESNTEPISVVQSSLWGLAGTIRLEFPEFRCTSVDLSADGGAEEVRFLADEIVISDDEDQIALRAGNCFIPRMTREQSIFPSGSSERLSGISGEMEVTAESTFRLDMLTPGTVEGLALRAVLPQEPAPKEIIIRVYAAGLNFVDVLKTLNMIPTPAGERFMLGGECAGRVVAIGTDVTSFQVGEEVIAIAPGSFASHTIAHSSLTVHKPDSLSFEQACAIPVAFLTAFYALVHLGRLAPGERVLIHAATGGVGMAAVQIAQQIGAEIYATAGSPEKREFLRSMGIERVMDSRSLSFADDLVGYTDGEGVDVILNSLAGEAIPRGLALLKPYGRFLEIGKRDIAQDSKLGLRPFRNNLSFFAIDLDRMQRERPDEVGALLREVMERLNAGSWQPPPFQTFPIASAVDAFRTMAQAKHIGKIIISVPDVGKVKALPPSTDSCNFRPDVSYAIAGGTGGLGLAVAHWMVERGARHLALISRRGASGVEAAIDQLRKRGAQVMVVHADIAQERQAARAIAEIEQAMPPLKGIVHAAGVLMDGPLERLDENGFHAVTAPKINGAWNLHTCTLSNRLDFFVMFSSAAALLGSPGQANYAAANSFLDALARYRRALGLPSLSINWGPWAEIGMAARPDRREQLKLHGLDFITPQQGLSVLDRIWRLEAPQIAVLPIDWEQWRRSYAGANEISILREIYAKSLSVQSSPLVPATVRFPMRQTLLDAKAGERRELVEKYLSDRVARTLGLKDSEVTAGCSLSRLGLDSLVAVELTHQIELDFGISLPVVRFLEGATIAQLTSQIMDQALTIEAAAAQYSLAQSAKQTSHLNRETAERLLDKIDQLSETELDSLLTDLLAH